MRKKWTKEDRNGLAVAAQNGDQRAAAELVYSMRGLIIQVSRKFSSTTGADAKELQAEGDLVVLECVRKFDPGRAKAGFGALVYFELLQSFHAFARKNVGPTSALSSRREKQARSKLRFFLANREAAGLSSAQALAEAAREFNLSETDLAAVLQERFSVSLGSDERDFEPVSNTDTEADSHAASLRRLVAELAAGLPDLHRRVLAARFNEESTQEVIAAQEGVSRQRVGSILAEAMAHVRRGIVARGLSLEDIVA